MFNPSFEEGHFASLSTSFPSSHNYYYSSLPGCSTPIAPMASPERMDAVIHHPPPILFPPHHPHQHLTQSKNNAFTLPLMDEERQKESSFLSNFQPPPSHSHNIPSMTDTTMENIPWSPNYYSPDPHAFHPHPMPPESVPPPRHSSFSALNDFQKRGETPKNNNNNIIASTSQQQPQTPLQYSQQTDQQQRHREQRRAMYSQNKVQYWQQFSQMSIQDSGVHSMSHSTAPSVMSSIHPASCMSNVSSLPDDFSGLKEHPYFQHIPNTFNHEEPEKMRQVLPELIPLINDESVDIVKRALTILISVAKKDKEFCTLRSQLDTRPLIVEKRQVTLYVLKALYFISDNDPSGRDLFVKTLNAHGTDCLEELVHCIGIQDPSCYKFAFLLLHNLMTDIRIGRKVIAYMCEMRILTKVLSWLSDKNEKFLSIVTDIIYMLLNKNTEQMAFFIGLNGHEKLVNILANSHQENLLYRAVKLLNRVVQIDPNKIVSAGLLEAAQKHLDHASQRMLRQLLDCIKFVSHVPSGDRDIHLLLQKLLQLLGTNDMKVKECCTDILANLSANNTSNKEFLVDKGAVFGLFQLLQEMEALNEALGQNTQRQNIQETALSLLRSLSSGNVCSGKAKQQIIKKEIHKKILLERMRNKQRNWPLLKKTFALLQYIAQEESLLKEFRFAMSFPPNFPQLPDAPLLLKPEYCSFVSQIVVILTEGLNSLPQSWELCQKCLDLLGLLAGDEGLLGEIFSELSARWIRLSEFQPKLLAPQVILRFFEQLAPPAIALLAQIARIPEAAIFIGKDRPTLDTLRKWSINNNDVNSARFAECVLQLVDSANGKQQQNASGKRVQIVGEERQQGQQQQPPSVNDKRSFPDTEMDFSMAPTSSTTLLPCSPSNFLLQTDNSNNDLKQQQQPSTDCLASTLSSFDNLSDFGTLVGTFCPSSSPVWGDIDFG
uniref:Uncharacterized protein n=1 Tax=Meloidogyne enterolobii TaxID=390850 RepID=A0A6V7UM51_MELEN|nr:unnamed protein product [Meloidogyne enterolobii]